MLLILCRRVRPLKSAGPHVRGEHSREQVRRRLRLQHPAECPQSQGIPKGASPPPIFFTGTALFNAKLLTRNFAQECHCCRESSYRQRQITLTNCFNSDGVRLSGEKGSMVVAVNEPVDCKCHECGKKIDAPAN